MPKLVLFAACEKVIVDQQNLPSLISLLQELKVQVPETGATPPANTNAAIKWDVLALWERTADDAGKHYEQRIVLFNPAGEPTGVTGVSSIEVGAAATMHRNIATIAGFPIGAAGRYTLRLWLSENGQESQQPVAEYSINVVYDVLRK
jgi:hypothetical protein